MKKKTWHVSYQAPERFGLCNNKGFKAAAICQNHHEHRCGPPRVAGQFPKDKASIKMHAFLLLHTLPAFLCLQRACDGKHKHEAWAFAKSSAEMSYPWDLAREMSSLVRKQLLDLGCSDTPQRLQDLDNII